MIGTPKENKIIELNKVRDLWDNVQEDLFNNQQIVVENGL